MLSKKGKKRTLLRLTQTPICDNILFVLALVAQLDRAIASDAMCRWFESNRVRHAPFRLRKGAFSLKRARHWNKNWGIDKKIPNGILKIREGGLCILFSLDQVAPMRRKE